MRDAELYRQILGLMPLWAVTTVRLDLTSQTVTVDVPVTLLNRVPSQPSQLKR